MERLSLARLARVPLRCCRSGSGARDGLGGACRWRRSRGCLRGGARREWGGLGLGLRGPAGAVAAAPGSGAFGSAAGWAQPRDDRSSVQTSALVRCVRRGAASRREAGRKCMSGFLAPATAPGAARRSCKKQARAAGSGRRRDRLPRTRRESVFDSADAPRRPQITQAPGIADHTRSRDPAKKREEVRGRRRRRRDDRNSSRGVVAPATLLKRLMADRSRSRRRPRL